MKVMNVKRQTPDIQPMHPLRYRSIRRSMYLFPLFLVSIQSVSGQSETNALPTLLPPHGQIQPTFWEQHGKAVIAGSFIVLALAASVIWRILKPRPQPILPPAIAAREALAKCRARPEDGNVLSEVSRLLRRYVGAVFEFPRGEFTTAEFCRELECSEKIAPELKHAISDFLRACDERKFSPAISSAPLNAAGRALELLAFTEKETQTQGACASKNERRV